jgi:hypothetical protein
VGRPATLSCDREKADPYSAGKQFFFEKRTKKLLLIRRARCRSARTNGQKFFGSFFKKELLPLPGLN